MSESKHTDAPEDRKPLSAEFVVGMSNKAKAALGDTAKRRVWPNSKAGSPVTVMLLCGEIARLNIAHDELLAVAKSLLEIFDHPTRRVTALDADRLRAALAKAEASS